jgi:hypothetical protein
MSARDERESVQEALRSGDFETTNFGSPENGRVIELLLCEHLDLEYVDSESVDALSSDGQHIQTKACRYEHANGGEERVPGRWDVWREGVLSLLHDDGLFLLAVYDGDVDPAEVDRDDLDDYILAWRFVEARDLGALIDADAWHDGGRPSKGQRARVFWTDVFDREEVEP